MATLMVGVSGVRGIVGQSLTPLVALEFAQAYGTLLNGGRVVLARDTRPSGAMFEAAATAGLLAAGCRVTQLGVAMTPTIGHAIQTGGYDAGMSITASHNPQAWNGLKFLDSRGLAPDPQRAAEIAAIRREGRYRLVEQGFVEPVQDSNAGERHVKAVLAACEVDLKPLRGMKVVLDCINGAGCRHTPGFLRALGCEPIVLNGEPSGQFAHTPEPVRENLGDLCRAVREHRAAVGFAQDPDADRLAIVDERGEYIGEEYTLALAVRFVLGHRPGPVAANLSTSRMIDDIAAAHGVRVFRTPVGEAHVARRMIAEGCVIGGEGNGGDRSAGVLRAGQSVGDEPGLAAPSRDGEEGQRAGWVHSRVCGREGEVRGPPGADRRRGGSGHAGVCGPDAEHRGRRAHRLSGGVGAPAGVEYGANCPDYCRGTQRVGGSPADQRGAICGRLVVVG